MEQMIGIVGGMGPKAGIALMNTITEQTNATCDQDHLPVILMSYPRVPDRTFFLDNKSTVNPGYQIAKSILQLEKAGATIIGIACNTSHCPTIFDLIQKELLEQKSKVRLLHMPMETCQYLKRNHPKVNKVGFLSTNGTYRSQLYEKLLQQLGFKVILPDFDFQNEIIHNMVYDPHFGIKAHSVNITTEVIALKAKALQFFRDAEADAIILACTEFSLVFPEEQLDDLLIIDSSKSLALSLINALK